MCRAREVAAITQTFTNYVQTFQTLDPHATLLYCHVPCLFLSPQGVRVLATTAEVLALFTQVMTDLQGRGYARSAVTDLHVTPMSATTAFVSVRRVRYTTEDQEL